MTLEYKQSLTEINTILDFMGTEYTKKLPKQLIKFIKENMDTSYQSNISKNQPINEQPIKKDTKILLSLIYRNYWCTQEEKKILMDKDKRLKEEYEKEIHEKYKVDNLFKNKNANEIETNLVEIAEYHESVFKKMLNKIKKIFNRKSKEK